MSIIDLLKDWKEQNPQVENVVLFVSDALRWDHVPVSVTRLGVTLKTVASSIWTPASFPSILTGLLPQHHGIHSFEDKIASGMQSLLNLRDYNTSLWTANTWTDHDPPESSPLYRFLRHSSRISLEELEPPFIYLEDEKGGHCPYGWTATDEEYKEWDCLSFFRDYGKKGQEALRSRYQYGIERSVREFENRLRLIDDRGLADNTLVVFLSDHGELLGEHGGLFGHGNLTTPEVVYVPTIFIHPDMPKGKNSEKEGIMRHIDVNPTICDLLDRRVRKDVDGVSLFKIEKLPEFGCSYFLQARDKFPSYEVKEIGVWDEDGGYLFREGSPILSLLQTIYNTAWRNDSINAIYQRARLRADFFNALRNYGVILKSFCSPLIRYNSPSFDLKKARALKTEFENSSKDKVLVPISASLYGKVRRRIELGEGSSRNIDKYIEYLLREAIEGEEARNARPSEEKEKAKKRLKSLGYF